MLVTEISRQDQNFRIIPRTWTFPGHNAWENLENSVRLGWLLTTFFLVINDLPREAVGPKGPYRPPSRSN